MYMYKESCFQSDQVPVLHSKKSVCQLTDVHSAMNQVIAITVSFTLGAFLTVLVQLNTTTKPSSTTDIRDNHIHTRGLQINATRRSISAIFATEQDPALFEKRKLLSSTHLVGTSLSNKTIRLQPLSITLHQAYPYSDARPSPRSLFWILWESHRDLRPKLLSTRFVRGIVNGNLLPDAYGAWTVVDAYYCFRGAASYHIAAKRATQMQMPDVAAFIATKAKEYDAFNDAVFVSGWNLRNRESIIPSAVMEAYADFEENVARRMHPVYSLIVQLPCEVVWAWLGDRLLSEIGRRENEGTNLYKGWAEANVWETAGYAIGNFVEEFQRRYPNAIEDHVAHRLYRRAFKFEIDNFNDA